MPKQKPSTRGQPKATPGSAATAPSVTRTPARATPAVVSRSVENKESVPMKAAAGKKSTPAAVKAAKPAGKTATSKADAATPTVSTKKAVAKKAAPTKAAATKAAPTKAAPTKAAPKKAVATPSPTHSDKQSVTEKKTQPTQPKPPIDNGVTMQDGRYALSAATQIELPEGYRPSSKEEYMNPLHLEFFRRKLQNWREDLVEESKQTIENLRDEVRDVGDEAERATRETENSLELRTRDRYRKLIAKINKALKRIEEGHYGYCEETDEEIGVDRLEARPIATLSLDAQERWEHRQKQMGD